MNKHTRVKIATTIGFILIGIFLIIAYQSQGENNKINEINYSMEVCNEDCNNVYLGMCLDNSSKFYMCNLIDEKCDKTDFELVNKIKYFEDNKINIYGLSTCPHCINQLSEFGKYNESVLEKEIFVFCDKVNNSACDDVTSVPTWKQNGKILTAGYIPFDNLDF